MRLDIQLFADGSIEVEVVMETRSLEQQIEELTYDIEGLYKKINDPKATPKQIKEYQRDLKICERDLKNLLKQQEELNKSNTSGMSGVLKSMSKWGLAIFGVRSAYMLIRQSASQLAQQNEEIAYKLEAIRGSLANLLAPIIEVIVNLVFRLLQYINILTKMWFGIDLFKNTAKSGKSAVKSAQKLRKTLAGFDEMNILNDNVTASGGDNKNGFDFPEPDGDLAKKIKRWGSIIKAGFGVLSEKIKKSWTTIKTGFMVASNYVITQAQKMGAILGTAFTTIGIKSQWAWNTMKIGATNFTTIVPELIGNATARFERFMDNAGSLLGILNGKINDFLYNLQTKSAMAEGIAKTGLGVTINWIITKFAEMHNKVFGFFAGIGAKVREEFGKIPNSVNTSISAMVSGFNTLKSKASNTFTGIKDVVKGQINVMIGYANKLINGLNKLNISVPAWVNSLIGRGNKSTSFGFNLKTIPKLAKGGIINMPGRGIPLATGGESGREGVIPLTDSQQMALLGEAIGRYITINANITNSMNGRIISRELQRINAENNFAGNR